MTTETSKYPASPAHGDWEGRGTLQGVTNSFSPRPSLRFLQESSYTDAISPEIGDFLGNDKWVNCNFPRELLRKLKRMSGSFQSNAREFMKEGVRKASQFHFDEEPRDWTDFPLDEENFFFKSELPGRGNNKFVMVYVDQWVHSRVINLQMKLSLSKSTIGIYCILHGMAAKGIDEEFCDEMMGKFHTFHTERNELCIIAGLRKVLSCIEVEDRGLINSLVHELISMRERLDILEQRSCPTCGSVPE